ncbi:MAG: amino acid adenylation domain-containing protein [bacterium]|nr:amino acid adenylation domain-containing protein [bacterium]
MRDVNEILLHSKYIKQRSYWEKILFTGMPGTEFNPYYPPSNHQGNTGKETRTIEIPFSPRCCTQLMNFSKTLDLSIYILLLTVLKLLIYRYTNNPELTVISPVYTPNISEDTLNSILFVHDSIEPDMQFIQLVLQVRASVLGAYENQDYPSDKLVKYLFPSEQSKTSTSLSNVVCLLQNIHDMRMLEKTVTTDKLIFSFARESDRIIGSIRYSPSDYDEDFLRQVSGQFPRLLESALGDVKVKIPGISFSAAEETRRLLEDFNRTNLPYPSEKSLHRLVEEQVERTPYHIALSEGESQLTYRGLDQLGNGLAGVLREKGVKTGTIAGIMVERSMDAVLGIMAVLKAGAAFLPIDPQYPGERKRFIIKDSDIKVILTQRHIRDRDMEVTDSEGLEEMLLLDDETVYPGDFAGLGTRLRSGRELKDSPVVPGPAYIIYTSGTTGRPNGVMVEHQGAVNYIYWAAQTYVKKGSMDFPLYTSISFDLTITSIFTPLVTGNRVVIYEDGQGDQEVLIRRIIRENRVGVIKLTPSHLMLIQEMPPEDPCNIKCFVVGGEDFKRVLARDINRNFPSVEIYNEYGPTEATVGCMIYRFDPAKDDRASVPIGIPIANTQIYILDGRREPVAAGIVGELYISGDGIARGYLNRPELTVEKFDQDLKKETAASPAVKTKLYKTGDLARWLPPSGQGEPKRNIEFLGRVDHQVKIRGFRIELGEIEYQLLQHEKIKEAIVLARKERKSQEVYLCAYVVPAEGDITSDEEIRVSKLKDFFSDKLPGYMIPTYFVQLDSLPLTANGKVDRQALPLPNLDTVKHSSYVPPRNETEKKLVEIWLEVLDSDIHSSIGIADNFFELGGHSLKAIQLASKIHKAMQVNLPLADLFKRPTINELAAYIKNAEKSTYFSIAPSEEKEFYVPSSSQKRLYFLQQMKLESKAYNLPGIFLSSQETDQKKLKDILKKVIARHASFRTSFQMLKGKPVQRIHSEVAFNVEYFDLSHGQRETGTNEEQIIEDFVRPFDLSKAPLIRCGLIKTGEPKHILMVDMHHIISDGVSHVILMKDFTALYNGEELPALELQYKDYAEWQSRGQQRKALESQEEFWIKKFREEIPVLNLPTDFTRPGVQSFAGSMEYFEMDEEQTHALNQLAKKENTTLYILLFAAFNVMLAKLSNQENILVGSPVAGRRHDDLENIIGMFVNTLALGNDVETGSCFIDFLQSLKANTVAAFENQDYPFEVLVETVTVSRDVSRNPLFDVMFVLQNMDSPDIEVPGLTLTPYTHKNNISKFDLTLAAIETNKELLFSFEYCVKLFKKETLQRFIVFFKNIVSSILANPGKRISDMEIIPGEEKKQLLYDFNNTNAEYPKDKTVHELFERQVEKTPAGTAVIFEDIQLTYEELNRQINRISYYLSLNSRIQGNGLVGVILDRSHWMVLGLLAILKIGAAYVPIDPHYPQDRIDYILKDSACRLIVTNERFKNKTGNDFNSGVMTLDFLDTNHKDNTGEFLNNPSPRSHPQDIAYVIYTSGTTGFPKGCMVSHRNVVRLIDNNKHPFDFNESDVWIMSHSYCFDFSVWELYGAILNGGKLIIPAWDHVRDISIFLSILKLRQVTVLNQTPASFYHLMEEEKQAMPKTLNRHLRYVIFGGDKLEPSRLNRWLEDYPLDQTALINMYGITETTVHVTYCPIKEEDIHCSQINSPIGIPLPETTLYILDFHRMLVPVGVVGEIYVGGTGVSRGYLNRVALTAGRFIQNPFRPGEILYKSGDMGQWLPEGTVQYLGRNDQQVKIRGYRIELGEIKNRLLSHDDIKEAVVIAREDSQGDKYLSAFIVPAEQDTLLENELNIPKIKDHLAQELPGYMIPSYFIQLEKIPLTSNGKVDKKALPLPGLEVRTEYVAPRDETETKIAKIWADVLGGDHSGISIHADFFELGGHSLKATIMVSKIHKALNVKLPLVDIFQNPTIQGLARCIHDAAQERYTAIEPSENREYYGLSSAQKRLFVIQQMDLDNTVFNSFQTFQLLRKPDISKFERSFKELISRHEVLRTSFIWIAGVPMQKVHSPSETDFAVEHYKIDKSRIDQTINRVNSPFNLQIPPLFRVALMEMPDGEYMMIVNIHHIISDGISNTILITGFLTLYHGEQLPPIGLSYKDFARWQNRMYNNDVFRQQEEYWLERFKGELPLLELPTDYDRPMVKQFSGDYIRFELEAERIQALKTLALEEKVTPFMLLLSLYYIFLSRMSLQEDIVVGTPEAGRRHANLNQVVGIFINTLALRGYPGAGRDFKDFLQQVKRDTLGAFENRDYQFEDMVSNINLPRDTGRNPLFDVMFDYHNENESVNQLQGRMFKSVTESEIHTNKTSMFDLNLHIIEYPERLGFTLDYCTDLFEPSTIQRFIRYFNTLVEDVVQDPSKKIGRFSILTGKEKERILFEFNDTAVDYSGDMTLNRIFEEQVERTPLQTAAIFYGTQISYKELNRKANQLAAKLRETGKTTGFLSVIQDRTIEMIITVLGILKAGAAYVPLEPYLPAARIIKILKSLGSTCILTNHLQLQKVSDVVTQLPQVTHVFCLDDDGDENRDGRFPGPLRDGIQWVSSQAIGSAADRNLSPFNAPGDIAYTIYTSGSTGMPKGVVVEHRTVINLIEWVNRTFNVGPSDKLLFVASLSFDLSVYDIFGVLACGGTLQVVSHADINNPERLLDLILSGEITFWDSAPAALQQLVPFFPEVANHKKNSHLRLVFLSGDWIPVTLPDALRETFEGVNVISLGGATEATIWSNFYPIKDVDPSWKSIPYGKPIENATYYILDRNLETCPIRIPGDLYIGGQCLAIGYINDVPFTSSKFIDSPFVPGEKIYKTGDLARWFDDGNMEFLGRVDHQVKLRGLRIELGEIETQLLGIENVREVVVLIHGTRMEDKYLCAYIVLDQDISTDRLREELASNLPEYMIPSYFVTLDKMPVSANGKLDRKALPEPDKITLGADGEYIAPRNSIEVNVAEIWAGLLGIEREKVGIEADFFAVGGNSLKAIKLILEVRKKWQVKISLVSVFTRSKLREMSEDIRDAQKDLFVSIEPAEEKDYYGLSPMQKRLYFLYYMEDQKSTAYNIPGFILIEGELQKSKLETVFKKLLDRHESLRTAFFVAGEELFQKVCRDIHFTVQHYEIAENLYDNLNDNLYENAEIQSITGDFIQPFDLARAPLLRVGILKIGETRHILMIDMHHIVSDGTSLDILMEDFTALYNDIKPRPLRIQYKDFVQWKNTKEQGETLVRQKVYWLEMFAGEIPVLELPWDYPRPVVKTFDGNSFQQPLEFNRLRALRKIAQDEGATLFIVLLAIFNVLMAKLSGQENIVVGTAVEGRGQADLHPIIGMFVNTLPLYNTPRDHRVFREFLKEVKTNALNAFENSEYQFEDLVETLDVKRNTGRNPLFDVMFTLQNMEQSGLELPGLTLNPFNYDNRISKFDLTLSAVESKESLSFTLEYSTNLFAEETIERFTRYFNRIVTEVIGNPDKKIFELEIVTREERQQLLFDFNDTAAEYPRDKTSHQLFEMQAGKTPGKIAVIHEERELTYGILNQKADRLAGYLQTKGVTTGSIVGIMANRSPEMVVAIIAILKAGGAFLPIDSDYPAVRKQFVLEDSETRWLLTHRHLFRKEPGILSSVPQENILFLDDEHICQGPVIKPGIVNKATDLVYIIYTSGTTGKPKGVMIEHRGLVNYTWWAINQYVKNEDIRFPLYTSISFDLTITSIFTPLLSGNAMVIYDEDHKELLLEKIIDEDNVGLIKLTPTHLKTILDKKNVVSNIKRFIVGGEELKSGLASSILENFKGDVEIYNEYGPTETVVGCMIYKFDPCQTTRKSVPIGKPAHNTRIYICDRNMKPVPISLSGELYVGGDGVARGYWKRESLTAEKFVKDPFVEGERIYKTGDLARRLPDNNIEFLGRIDNQVKIRGYRIELEDIEHQLLSHEQIKEAVAVVRETGGNSPGNGKEDKYLCGYIVSDRQFTVTELREYLSRELPDYMLPSYFVRLSEIPVTANGKIDKNALPKPDGSIGTGVEYIPPGNEAESRLAEIWEQVLEINGPGINDDFFNLGGNSLKLIKLHSHINKHYPDQIKVQDLFDYRTIKELAVLVQENIAEPVPKNDTKIKNIEF